MYIQKTIEEIRHYSIKRICPENWFVTRIIVELCQHVVVGQYCTMYNVRHTVL